MFDPDQEPQPDTELLHAALTKGYEQPFILVDSSVVREKVRRFRKALPRVHIHYAVKCNPDPSLLSLLHNQSCGFEVASPFEIDLCIRMGVAASQLYFSNPVRSRRAIAYAAQCGIDWFVVDSVNEIRKVYSIKPDAHLYVRLKTSNQGAVAPLDAKFGAEEASLVTLLDEAAILGADVAGATFHAGSQCLNPDNWRKGTAAATAFFAKMRQRGFTPRLLNLGGGYPVQHDTPIPSIAKIGQVINMALDSVPDDIRVMAEPGRFLVSDSAWLICQVIGTTERNGQNWAYLDVGVFNGLLESTTGIRYDIQCNRQGNPVRWTLAGPTCDSYDICTHDQMLPADLQEGDLLFVRNAGAYTNACAGRFNGFDVPDVVVV